MAEKNAVKTTDSTCQFLTKRHHRKKCGAADWDATPSRLKRRTDHEG
jgi:hypothetical protein